VRSCPPLSNLTRTIRLEFDGPDVDQRPRLPFTSPRDFTDPKRVSARAVAVPLSQQLKPIVLDPLTVVDDANFLTEIANQPNVPEPIRTGLAGLY
jgi:5-methylthioadenosine/S-adenosylhomocysteine deaminase